MANGARTTKRGRIARNVAEYKSMALIAEAIRDLSDENENEAQRLTEKLLDRVPQELEHLRELFAHVLPAVFEYGEYTGHFFDFKKQGTTIHEAADTLALLAKAWKGLVEIKTAKSEDEKDLFVLFKAI